MIDSTILISNYTGEYLSRTQGIELVLDPTGTQFTTGDNENGYLLTKVTHGLRKNNPGTGIVSATVNANNAGSPGTELYVFPDQSITGTVQQAVTHVGEVLLEPNRKYWITLKNRAGSTSSINIYWKQSYDIATGLADWTISSGSVDYYDGAWHNDSNSYSIRLEGFVQPPTILTSNYTGAYNPGTESRRLTASQSGTQFTTGDNRHGYLLTKVTHGMGLVAADSETARLAVTKQAAGIPSASFYEFPDQTITTINPQEVTHVGEVLLEPNTKYWILIRRSSYPTNHVETYYKRSDDVDTGQPGWTLATSSNHFNPGWQSLNSAYALRLEGIILAPVTNEPRYRDFPMDTSTLGRLKLGETSTGTLDATDDNLSGDLLKIEGLTPGNSYRVRAWFGTSKEDSATAARGGAIGLQFSRAGIELASLSPHNDNLLDDGRASFAFPAFANEEYYVDLVAPAFRPPNGQTPAHTYYGPYMLEIYDLGVTQRTLGVTGQTCTDGVCTGGTMQYSEGYGIKASNICVNNRCYNDPRFEEFWVDGYANTEDHEVTVGSTASKNLLQAIQFRVDNRSGSTTKWKLDRIGTFIHSMTANSIPQAAIYSVSAGVPGDQLFDLEPLYNDDRHIDYFVAPSEAQALDPNTFYFVVFSEGGGGTNFYKLYVTTKHGEDDNRHPNWPIDNAGITKDDDATPIPGFSGWDGMRKDDTMGGTPVLPQIRVYAGVAE